MPRQMKVYGITLAARRGETTQLTERQVRAIVAAPSWVKAAEAFHCSEHHARRYGCVTGNPTEVAIAMAKPGAVFVRGFHPNDGPWIERVAS